MFKSILRKWVIIRMAAQEFYYKEPFVITDEYPIIKWGLVLSLTPIEMIFVFSYARIFGSLSEYRIPILIVLFVVNLAISSWCINMIKRLHLIDDAISYYEQLDYEKRRKLYSFKSVASVVMYIALLPWITMAIGIFIVCKLFPL